MKLYCENLQERIGELEKEQSSPKQEQEKDLNSEQIDSFITTIEEAKNDKKWL